MNKLKSLRITDETLSESKKIATRQAIISEVVGDLPALFDRNNLPDCVGDKNCENWVGSVPLPVGVAGPLTINFLKKTTKHYLPLATTEGALVASISRGAKVISLSGGANVVIEKMGMSRAPVFKCETGAQALEVKQFIEKNIDKLIEVAEETSNHLKYLSHQIFIRGQYLYLRLSFDTDQAMGMNMVTIASQAVANWLESQFNEVSLVALSSNVCTDKKDNLINTLYGRGYWAQAEVIISDEVIRQNLKTTREKIKEVHLQKNLIGSNLAGSFSQNAHVANVLAAIYLATGQDPAHVVEGSRAFLSVNDHKKGLYISLTLPSINVGTVGGGTYLPAQKQARDLIGRELKTEKLVAVISGACLAGELSLIASLSAHSLAKAHQDLGRGKK